MKSTTAEKGGLWRMSRKPPVADSDAVSKCSEVKFSDSHVHMVTGNAQKTIHSLLEMYSYQGILMCLSLRRGTASISSIQDLHRAHAHRRGPLRLSSSHQASSSCHCWTLQSSPASPSQPHKPSQAGYKAQCGRL